MKTTNYARGRAFEYRVRHDLRKRGYVVIRRLHREVCAGRISLSDAQHQIATDWFAVYQRMTAEQQRTSVKPR